MGSSEAVPSRRAEAAAKLERDKLIAERLLAAHAESVGASEALRRARAGRHAAIDAARAAGWTFADIGRALGVSKERARQHAHELGSRARHPAGKAKEPDTVAPGSFDPVDF